MPNAISRRAALAGIAYGLLPWARACAQAGPSLPLDAIRVRSFGATGDGRTDDTAAIQRAIDHHRSLPSEQKARRPIVLDGTYLVSRVTITQANNGLTFGHGRLVRSSGAGPGPNALVTVVQEANSRIALENITVEQLEVEGRARYTAVDPSDEADTAANHANFQLCNGVEFLSAQADPASRGVRNCRARFVSGSRLGKSVVIFDEPEGCSAEAIRATQCVGHAVAVSATSDHRAWRAGRRLSIDISQVEGRDTMTLLDLSAITDYDNNDRFLAYANVRGLNGRRIRGRTKIAGVWGVNLSDLSVDNDGMPFRAWGAIELAAREYSHLTIARVYARNMRGAVIGNVYSQETPVHLSDIAAVSCNAGVSVTAKTVLVRNLTTIDTYIPMGVSSENETVLVDGFRFSRVSRQSYVNRPAGIPEYGIQSVPSRSLTFRNGTIATLGNDTLAYNDIFIYVPPSASGAAITISNVEVIEPANRPFRHFLRNDSPSVTMIFEDFRVAAGAFTNFVITNTNRRARLATSRTQIRNAMTIDN